MEIKAIVESLCKKYDTRDPYEIAKQKGIIVHSEPLGEIRGYFNKCYRQKFIHINSDLPDNEQYMTCGHELGHAVMHPDSNTPFLRNFTMLSVDKLEIEANRFMVHLLYSDDYFEEYCYYTVPQVAQILHISEELVEYKFKMLKSYN